MKEISNLGEKNHTAGPRARNFNLLLFGGQNVCDDSLTTAVKQPLLESKNIILIANPAPSKLRNHMLKMASPHLFFFPRFNLFTFTQ